MAALTKGTNPGLTTPEPPNNARVGSGIAEVAIYAGAPCRFTTTGGVTIASGAADNAAAVVDGWAMKDYSIGETVTLYSDVNIGYGKGSNVVPGTFYYLNTTAPGVAGVGGLADAPPFEGAPPVARGVPDNSLFGTKQHKLRVFRSYPSYVSAGESGSEPSGGS
jgi:hypothetical protein